MRKRFVACVGERQNSRREPQGAWTLRRALESPAFVDGPSANRINELGLRNEPLLMNLLPPAPNVEGPNWMDHEQKLARDVADGLVTLLVETRGSATFVLFGAKVCAAFGCPYQPSKFFLDLGGQWYGPLESVDSAHMPRVVALVLPHPSGLCRWWNEPANCELAAKQLASMRRIAHV